MNRTKTLCLLSLSWLLCAPVWAEAVPAPVVVDVVRAEAVEALQSATGSIYSRDQMQVRATVSGRLQWIREAGVAVLAGEELARIDVTPLILQREERLARIARNQVQLRNLDTQLQRYSELKQDAYYSDVELDDLRAQRDLAQADLNIAKVLVRQLDEEISRASIRAPFAGVVTQQQRFVGEEVQQGEDLSQVLSVQNLELRAQLPLSWLSRLHVGDVMHASAAGEDMLGTIRSLIPNGDRMAQTFEARIDLPADAALKWAPGQLTQVKLPTSLLESAILVPRDALVLRRDAKYVYRISAENKAEQVAVKLGSGRGAWIVVNAKLAAGERLAVRGAERLRDGQEVEVIRDLAFERGSENS